MLSREIEEILTASRGTGWVLEPDAKRVLALAGLEVPRFGCATSREAVIRIAQEIGFPLAAKVVSPKVLHKSDLGGVVVDIESVEVLMETYQKFSRFDGFRGMHVEEMVSGVELIVGAKIDYQFGPVILLGIGGTVVEIYKDTTLRMAPLQEKNIHSMIQGLKGRQLLEGYRGSEGINLGELTRLLMAFSDLVVTVQDRIESIDLNPVKCSSKRCVVADARILLSEK